MKTSIQLVTFLIFLVSINFVSAQYGNPYGRNNGMNQLGAMNRSEPEKPKEIPIQKIASDYMKLLKPALELDELQTIAITNLLIENFSTQGRIKKLELSQEELMKEYQLLAENTDKKINDFLNKDQKEKYIKFKEESRQNKKSSEKKKEKKKEKNTETKETNKNEN